MYDLNLQSGKILAIQGDKATVSTMLISMAVKLQQHSVVLYIDSAHSFNPGFIDTFYHNSRPLGLDRIKIARPLSPDQLLGVVKKLDKAIVETKAQSVFISALDTLFYFQDAHEKDLMFIFSQILDHLLVVVKRHKIVVLIGLSKAFNESQGCLFSQITNGVIDQCYQV